MAPPANATAPIAGLPPGPPVPKLIQSLAALFISNDALPRRLRARYGDMFTVRLIGLGKVVAVGDPELIKQVFAADPKVLHAGDQSPLGTVLGWNSLLAIDEDRHMSQRKLLLPAFHGERMQAYEALIEEEANREIDTWTDEVEFRTLEPMMRITLNVILRAVFGAEGDELTGLRKLLPGMVKLGSAMAGLNFLHHDLGPWSPWGRVLRKRAAFDGLVRALIDKARRDPQLDERSDVLSMLVQARHEDGTPMSFEEISDQLLTLLAAGHETTATSLAWAVERLRRHPDVLRRLVDEVDAGDGTLREATIREIQRTRPVIVGAGRFTKQPFELGGYIIPPGCVIGVSAGLTHNDPRLFPHPGRFDPDRFVGRKPEPYAWIPFGGGVRRCIGASFAHREMDVVLRTLLQRVELVPTAARGERWRFRGVAFAPAKGGLAVVRRRAPSAQSQRGGVAAGVAA
jgi:cytochrome P450